MPAPRGYTIGAGQIATGGHEHRYGGAVQSNVFYVMPTAHPADAPISGGI